LATAAHVALYNFDVPSRRWTRKDVEGSLFLVKRRGSPRFQIVILNKKSAENYVEDVGGGFQCELNPPYLLYRNKVGEVVGIWFYEQTDCKRMCDILSKISSTFAAPSDAEAGVGNGNTSNNNNNNNNSENAPSSQPASPEYTYSAAPVDDSYGQESGHQEDDEEDEGIFWDKRVEVPAEVGMPGSAAGSKAVEAPNALAGLLAGLKVAAAPQTQTTAPPSATQLLTPQFLLNQQQQQQQQQQTRPPPSAMENQGVKLLQSLRSASSSAVSAPTASAATVNNDAGKVSALLRALAENTVFCTELAKEIKQAGL